MARCVSLSSGPVRTLGIEHTVPQPSGTTNEYRLDLEGGASPVLAVRANAISSILGLNQTGAWVSLAERLRCSG